jgi:outer membrane lipoprotein-sorting protein
MKNEKVKVKKAVLVSVLLFKGFLLFAQTADEIMKNVDDRYQGETAQYVLIMTLKPKNGGERIREVSYFFKDSGATEKMLMTFRSPKDVAGTGYLVHSYDTDRKDDAWLYLPATERVRRIAGSQAKDNFMGTDFSYEDINGRDLSKDDFLITGEETIDGASCWVVEAKAKDPKDTVARRVIKVRKDNFVIAGAEYFDRRGKQTKSLAVSGIEKIDGIWTARKMEMRTLQSGHATVIEIKSPRFNQPLDDGLFSTNNLERAGR